MDLFVCSLTLLFCLTPSLGVKLLLTPNSISSHGIYFSRLAAALLEEGHSVSFLLASNARVPQELPEEAELITFTVPAATPYYGSRECSALFVKAAFAESFAETVDAWFKLDYDAQAASTEECHSLHKNQELISRLERANFDMVIMDPVSPITCGYILPYRAGVFLMRSFPSQSACG